MQAHNQGRGGESVCLFLCIRYSSVLYMYCVPEYVKFHLDIQIHTYMTKMKCVWSLNVYIKNQLCVRDASHIHIKPQYLNIYYITCRTV